MRSSEDPEYMKIPPLTIFEFRGTAPSEDYFLPELAKNRKCTDLLFLIIFLLYFVTMLAWSVSFSWHGNLKRTLNGYDSCGNLCGVDNKEITKGGNCKAENFKKYTVMLYSENSTKCIRTEDCKLPDLELVYRRCFPKDLQLPEVKREVLGAMDKNKISFIIMTSVALVLSVLVYFCFRVCPYITTITLTVSGMTFTAITSLYLSYMYIDQQRLIYLIAAILCLIYLTTMIILLLFLSNRYTLMTRLYSEAVKAIFKAPVLLLQPAMTITFIFVLNGLIIYLFLLVYLTEDYDDDPFKSVRPWYVFFLIVLIYWLYAIAEGCQCMIIAGVITAYYFTRDKPYSRLPYLHSIAVTLRYHLGTIAAGSLIIPFVRLSKPISNWIEKRKICCEFLKKCCEVLNERSAYLSRKAYIMTAIHGKSINPSGQRVARLVWLFLCDIISIDSLGCANMHFISFFFTLCSLTVIFGTITGSFLKHEITPLLIGLFFTGTVTFFYASLMNVVIETLVVCFCEDRLLNSGSRYDPFFMNPELFSVMIKALEVTYQENQENVSNP